MVDNSIKYRRRFCLRDTHFRFPYAKFDMVAEIEVEVLSHIERQARIQGREWPELEIGV